MVARPLSSVCVQNHVPAAGINPNAPVIGLVLQKSHINTKDECHYVALIAELEARGAKVAITTTSRKDFVFHELESISSS